jgi:hypothetical protein
MNQLNLKKEWDFICSETNQLHQSNKSYLTKELLFATQILLTSYCKQKDIVRKFFLASIYIRTKDKYLKKT